MKVLCLRENVVNIQKCLLGDSEFLQKNCGRHCIVPIPGTRSGLLVKIGLSEPKNITGVCFVDESVIVFESCDRTKKSAHRIDIDFRNLRLLPPVQNSKTVTVNIVFDDVTRFAHKKYPEKLKKSVREILRLYVLTQNSVVFLQNLLTSQRNGIYCLDIHEINGESNGDECYVYSVNQETNIDVNEYLSRDKYEQYCNLRKELTLGGLNHISERLEEIIELSRSPIDEIQKIKYGTKILLAGPSGCGKSSLVRSVTRKTKSTLLEISLPEICSSVSGGTEKQLNDVFNKAKILADNNENCVVLIEDVEVLCMRQRDDITISVRRNANRFIKLVEDIGGNGVVVIATTTNPEDVDPNLRRSGRFDVELEIMPPKEEDREEIISNILEYLDINCPKEIIEKFSIWTPGFVGADLYMAVQEGLLFYHKTKGSLSQLDYSFLEECFKKAVSNMTPTSLKGSTGLHMRRDTDFSHIGGLDDVKKLLDFSVTQQLLNPEAFTRMGIPLTKGILLYGPPGCAKTTLVKALAKESNTTFIAVSSADLYSPFVGDPEKKIIQLFSQARLGAPSIIFIDEIDGLVGSKSGDRSRGVQERVLSTLLVEMDGVGVKTLIQKRSTDNVSEEASKPWDDRCGVIVIGATNRPELLDSALKRPGRFDKIVYVPPPDVNERLNILKKLTEKMPLHQVDLEHLAKVTEYFSGADLKGLCYESALLALTESEMTATSVNQSHFVKVLSKTRPSLNSEMIRSYETFRENLFLN